MSISRLLIAAGMMLWMLAGSAPAAESSRTVYVPVIDGPWWQVAGNPDLGELTRKGQEPVDFGIWQAADGTWQLWSCIRGTKAPGMTRVFHGWEGAKLTDSDWKPLGITMQAKPELGETPGGLQAPHVVKHGGRYHMAYGDFEHIGFATSKDGKHFEREIQPDGKTGVFTEGIGLNTRDAMMIKIGPRWYCYYTAFPGENGYVFCRTSTDLRDWGYSCVVAYGGSVGTKWYMAECPHVVEVKPGVFVLFRNQIYGQYAQCAVYQSNNPLNFGIDDDQYFVKLMPYAAPEIIHHDGQYYIAALKKELDGIQIARLKWVEHEMKRTGEPIFDFDDPKVRASWKMVDGDMPQVFTTSERTRFGRASQHFIGTAETGTGRYKDRWTSVIESPPFTVSEPRYLLLLGGGNMINELYVAVVDAKTDEELARYTGGELNAMKPVAWDAEAYQGRSVLVRVVDKATGAWGHINFGGIYKDPRKAMPE